MEFFYNLDFTMEGVKKNEIIMQVNKNINVNFENEKVFKRLNKLKYDKAREIYETANFNFEMFEYALREYFRIKKER